MPQLPMSPTNMPSLSTRRTWLKTAWASTALSLQACKPTQSQWRRQMAHLEGGFTGVSFERGHVLRGENKDFHIKNSQTINKKTDIVIVGAGISGLSAAKSMRSMGIEDFIVVELEDNAGGNSRAGHIAGLPCPLGAHYLPIPPSTATEVLAFLQEVGLAKWQHNRWQFDERHVCHAPQERLFIHGQWQNGLLPVQGVGKQTGSQYRRFANLIAQWMKKGLFTMPSLDALARSAPSLVALDAQPFDVWLNTNNLNDPFLLWYLNYCSYDEYGAGIQSISAWAGIHYFASRHGFEASFDEETLENAQKGESSQGVFTWDVGNAYLSQALITPLAQRLQTGQIVLSVDVHKQGVRVQTLSKATGVLTNYTAKVCIMATPLMVTQRILQSSGDSGIKSALQKAAAHMQYSAWLVANLYIDQMLYDNGKGAHPSWDNVFYSGHSLSDNNIKASSNSLSNTAMAAITRGDGFDLGYVDNGHQRLDAIAAKATILTHYRALGVERAAKQHLLQQPWTHWRDVTLHSLLQAHADVVRHAKRLEITRYGHAMAVPTPLMHTHPALRALGQCKGRLVFAHSDLSAYSVFEEAYTWGARVDSKLSHEFIKKH